MLFRIRVDEGTPDPEGRSFRDQMVDYLKEKSHVLVHHVLPHGNPHYHVYVDHMLFKSIAAYKYQWKKLDFVKPLKQTDWSIKECSPERVNEYLAYLFNTKHGNVATLVSSTIDCAQPQAAAKAVSDDFAIRADLRKDKKQSVTTWDMAQELKQWIDAHEDDHDWQPDMVAEAIEIHRRHHKSFCSFSLSRMIQTAMGTSITRKNYIISDVMDKLFRFNSP